MLSGNMAKTEKHWTGYKYMWENHEVWNFSSKKKKVKYIYWFVICTVNYKLWKTRCNMIINQCHIPAERVFKQIVSELQRQKKNGRIAKNKHPWTLLCFWRDVRCKYVVNWCKCKYGINWCDHKCKYVVN